MGLSKIGAYNRDPTPHNASLARLASLHDNRLQRSKSCGQHRSSAPDEDFELCITTNTAGSTTSTSTGRSSPKHGDGQGTRTMATKVTKPKDEDSKCGLALCLFLPGFGKGKPVRARRAEQAAGTRHVISQRVSLEKFERGSWTASAILINGDEYSSNLYFDLPLELIRTSVSDTTLPMNAAFVFDKDVKGVLKTRGGAGERKSQEALDFFSHDTPNIVISLHHTSLMQGL